MDITKIYIGQNPLIGGKLIHKAELLETKVSSFKDMYDSFFKLPRQGHKQYLYTTIANNVLEEPADVNSKAKFRQKPFRRHYDSTQTSAQFIAYDGDGSKSNPDSCVPLKEIKKALDFYGYNYILYTTHSHSKTQTRWRVIIPCYMTDKSQLKPTGVSLFNLLEKKCPDLKWTNESVTWSQPWFLALRDDPNDGLHESYFNDKGKDFIAIKGSVEKPSKTTTSVLDSSTQQEIAANIVLGRSPLHDSFKKFIYGCIKDGRSRGSVIGDLKGMTSGWDHLDVSKVHMQYREDIERQVDHYINIHAKQSNNAKWKEELATTDTFTLYTKYPVQTGIMEDLVQACMQYAVNPDRTLAVLTSHALISCLGGRTYCDENRIGIVLTCLITGRSTIGKSFAAKFIKFMLNNFDSIGVAGKQRMIAHANEYVGAGYYTAVKNIERDLIKMPSMISFDSESGHSGKTTAGDMPRVRALEFNLSTETGPDGNIEAGGQNERVKSMYSPGFTSFKECTPKIQRELDIVNASDETGIEGRRSHAIMNPIRSERNYERLEKVPRNLKKLLNTLHKLAKSRERTNLSEPHAEWVYAKAEDPLFMQMKEQEFREKGDKAHMAGDEFTATYYGRLETKAVSWATRLAIADNPMKPVITNAHFETALKSIEAEHAALSAQIASGELDTSWPKIVSRIVGFFKGDMNKHKTLSRKCSFEMLKNQSASWAALKLCLGGNSNPVLKELMIKDNFPFSLERHLKLEGIVKLSSTESLAKYKRDNVFMRVD